MKTLLKSLLLHLAVFTIAVLSSLLIVYLGTVYGWGGFSKGMWSGIAMAFVIIKGQDLIREL